MKRFLLGAFMGIIIGWLTVPIVKASYAVVQSDNTSWQGMVDDDSPRTYKGFLNQILNTMKIMNTHLENIEENTKEIKDKLHS